MDPRRRSGASRRRPARAARGRTPSVQKQDAEGKRERSRERDSVRQVSRSLSLGGRSTGGGNTSGLPPRRDNDSPPPLREHLLVSPASVTEIEGPKKPKLRYEVVRQVPSEAGSNTSSATRRRLALEKQQLELLQSQGLHALEVQRRKMEHEEREKQLHLHYMAQKLELERQMLESDE